MDDKDDDLEYTLLNKREVLVYQIPPASSSAGHKADDWKKCIWRGRCRIVGKGKDLYIKLLDASSGNLFAQCAIPGGDPANYVDRVIDSSRYFVLKITNGDRHAFIGLGFEDRNDAFDFNCTLSDFKSSGVDRDVKVESVAEATTAKDFSLQEGQTIKINLKGLGTRKREAEGTGGYGGGGIGILAPPPASGPSRRQQAVPAAPLVAPVAAAPMTVQARPPTAKFQDDAFDFDDFQAAPLPAMPLPASTSSALPVTSPSVASVSRQLEQMNLGSAFGGNNFTPATSSAQLPATTQAVDPFAGFSGFSAAPIVSKPPASTTLPPATTAGAFGAFDAFAPLGSSSTRTPATTSAPIARDPFDDLDIFK
jgi:adaptin ear-binding coat-associated protein 1/2